MPSRDSLVPKARRFVKVLDGRQHPIRGLWMRGSRYYARLRSEDTKGEVRTRWVPLDGAASAAEARDKLRGLQVKREQAELVVTPSTPKFADDAQTYIERLAHSGKTAKTIGTEKGYLTFWREELGAIRIDKIRPHHLNTGLLKLRTQGLMPRTCKLSLTVLRDVFRAAKVDGFLTSLPVDGLQRFRVEHRPRPDRCGCPRRGSRRGGILTGQETRRRMDLIVKQPGRRGPIFAPTGKDLCRERLECGLLVLYGFTRETALALVWMAPVLLRNMAVYCHRRRPLAGDPGPLGHSGCHGLRFVCGRFNSDGWRYRGLSHLGAPL